MNKLKTILISGCVLAQCATSFAETNVRTQLRDEYVVKEVNTSFENNIMLKNSKINVAAKEGKVKLFGTVPSNSHYIEAISTASSTSDVVDVDAGSLTVEKSAYPLKDVVITTKIKGLLVKNKLVYPNQPSPYYVQVETNNNNVYLTGKVKDNHQSTKAIETAYSVNGVKKVSSYLKIADIRQPAKS